METNAHCEKKTTTSHRKIPTKVACNLQVFKIQNQGLYLCITNGKDFVVKLQMACMRTLTKQLHLSLINPALNYCLHFQDVKLKNFCNFEGHQLLITWQGLIRQVPYINHGPKYSTNLIVITRIFSHWPTWFTLQQSLLKPHCIMEIDPLRTSLLKWEQQIPWGMNFPTLWTLPT